MLLGLFILVSIAQASDEAHQEQQSVHLLRLMQQLTSCWILQIREVSRQTIEFNELLQHKMDLGATNKTALFYKIQTDMISSCITAMTPEQAKSIIGKIQANEKDHENYLDIVPEFKLFDYRSPLFDWEFSEDEKIILRHCQNLEKWIGGFETKPIKEANETKDTSKESKFAELRKYLNTMKKEPKQDKDYQEIQKLLIKNKKEEMQSPINYILAGLIITILIAGAFYSYKLLSQAPVKKSKKL